MLLLQQMIVLFILMLIGYYTSKKEFLSDMTFKHFSWVVVNIANPAMIISGSVNSENPIQGRELFSTLGLAIGLYVVLIVVSMVIPIVLRVPKADRGVYKVMMIFSNIGFMGFPLISSIYGADALLYASLFLIPFNVLMYTYGIMALKKQTEEKERIDWKKILNIGVICCAVSIIISFFQIQVPTFVKSTVTHLSNLTAPLSMMVIGASMTKIKFKDLFGDIRLLAFCVLKLLVIPILGLFVLKVFISSEMLLGVCMVMVATPIASMTAMMAQQYEGNYSLAAKSVALSTILSVVTIPIVSMITGI